MAQNKKEVDMMRINLVAFFLGFGAATVVWFAAAFALAAKGWHKKEV